uniref:Uncharacterized protein n=1 Tax=Mycena chlorophos TaxID=658473 RepID=A0ABQ0LHA3_MYCCL|nr:predicted protein [Mycena chlorophos]
MSPLSSLWHDDVAQPGNEGTPNVVGWAEERRGCLSWKITPSAGADDANASFRDDAKAHRFHNLNCGPPSQLAPPAVLLFPGSDFELQTQRAFTTLVAAVVDPRRLRNDGQRAVHMALLPSAHTVATPGAGRLQ